MARMGSYHEGKAFVYYNNQRGVWRCIGARNGRTMSAVSDCRVIGNQTEELFGTSDERYVAIARRSAVTMECRNEIKL